MTRTAGRGARPVAISRSPSLHRRPLCQFCTNSGHCDPSAVQSHKKDSRGGEIDLRLRASGARGHKRGGAAGAGGGRGGHPPGATTRRFRRRWSPAWWTPLRRIRGWLPKRVAVAVVDGVVSGHVVATPAAGSTGARPRASGRRRHSRDRPLESTRNRAQRVRRRQMYALIRRGTRRWTRRLSAWLGEPRLTGARRVTGTSSACSARPVVGRVLPGPADERGRH